MKIDRLLAKHDSLGRRRARQRIVEGRVRVNGLVERRVDCEVNRFSKVELDGAVIRKPERLLHLMLNKPVGVVSATVDAEHRTVIDLIDDPDKASLHLVGRLDRNTTGLVLLTNDGTWSKALMAPSRKVPKVYLVETRDPIPREAVAAFAKGFHFHTEDLTTLPATLEILGARGVPVAQCEEPHELVTPTGAALLAELVESFGPMCGLAATKIGYGLGMRENKTRPNVLRAVLGETTDGGAAHDWETDNVAVLETNLDDINAEILGAFVEKALGAGALDVFHTPIQMKKNRPGVLLSVLCAEPDADRFCELLLRETSAFGVRRTIAERRKLRRVLLNAPRGMPLRLDVQFV